MKALLPHATRGPRAVAVAGKNRETSPLTPTSFTIFVNLGQCPVAQGDVTGRAIGGQYRSLA